MCSYPNSKDETRETKPDRNERKSTQIGNSSWRPKTPFVLLIEQLHRKLGRIQNKFKHQPPTESNQHL